MAKYVLYNPSLANVKEVAYVSTYPPRKCGIATFTADLVRSMSFLNKLKDQTVIPIDGRRLYKSLFGKIHHKIGRDFIEDYALMADFLNVSTVNVVNLQHEFGIFGGNFGEYICTFLERLKKPVLTTLHTVLPRFESGAQAVFNKVVERSSSIVVLNQTTSSLVKQYGVPAGKIKVIPHGCPDIPLVSSAKVKPNLGLKNRFVLSTLGF